MNDMVKILCVDDERNVLRALERIFLDDDYEIITGSSGEEGLSLLQEFPDIQVVISDYRMPGMNGVEFLKEVFTRRPDTIRIVLSGYADTAAVVAAINEGQIYKFVPKPWNDDELRLTVAKAIETISLYNENRQLAEELELKNFELSKLNAGLEGVVSERTTELLLQNRLLGNFRNILNNLPVAVIGLTMDGVVVVVNRMATLLLGGNIAAAPGSGMDEVLPPALCAFARRVMAENKASESIFHLDKELLFLGSQMNEDGQDGVMLVFHNGA
jgi:two-component system NtrC family sensor kinase